jgi:hypothetical protein
MESKENNDGDVKEKISSFFLLLRSEIPSVYFSAAAAASSSSFFLSTGKSSHSLSFFSLPLFPLLSQLPSSPTVLSPLFLSLLAGQVSIADGKSY